MKVMLPSFVRGFVLLAAATLPTLEAVAQGPPGGSGTAQVPGTYSHAPAYYDEPFVGYQRQSALQSASQRNAAMSVLENNIGYQLRAPFGPQINYQGIFGDRRGIEGNDYSVSGFLPWHIDPNRTVAFAILRGTATDLGDFVGNFGIGSRMYLEELNRIIGFSLWYDIDDSHNQQYNRGGFQIEYLARYLELRAGTDIVLGTDDQILRSGFTDRAPFFRGNNVLFEFSTTREFAYNQTYAEAGGPMPYLGRYGVNAYAGAYYLSHDDAKDTLGWSIRTSADITRDVQVGMRHTHDDVFGHNTSASVTLSFPNGGLKQVFRSPRTIVRGQTPNLRETNQVIQLRPGSVANLMRSRVVRDHRTPVHIDTALSGVNAIDPVTGAPVCVIHVDPNSTSMGTGTFEDPFRTLEAARVSNDGTCRIIRVVPREDGTGTNLVLAGTFGLFTNQRLLGSSFDHLFETTRGLFTLPGFTGPGPGPVVTNSMGGDLIDMDDNTEVSGFQLVGSATGNGIVGNPVDFNINRNDIRGGLNGVRLTDTSGTGMINENTFADNTEAGAFVESNGAEVLGLIAMDNRFNGNGTGLDLQSNTGATQFVLATGNAFEASTNVNSGGFRAVADGGTINFLSVADNSFDNNLGNGMLLGVLNGGVLMSIGEDLDGDGVLDDGEDLNGNGLLDLAIARNTFTDNRGVGLWVRGGEDINRDGLFTANEDLNGNGVLDSGLGTMVNLDIGGPVASLGNDFIGNLNGGLAFDMMDDSMTTTRIRHNLITFQPQFSGDVIFVMDISGSTFAGFGGTPVGDLNGDGTPNTVLDGEIAGFIALNGEIINLGGGDSSRVALVSFDNQAFQRDMDPAAGGVQLATTPNSDTDANGLLDVDQVLRAEMSGGGTDFEVALQAAINTFNAAGLTPGNTTMVFISDGAGFGGGIADEVATLNALGVTNRAFGAGMGASLAQLQIIDPNATIVNNSDELIVEFLSSLNTMQAEPIDAVRMTFSDTAKLQPSEISNNTIGFYGRDGVNIETFNSATVEDIAVRSNTMGDLGRNGARLAAANTSRINLTNMTGNTITNNLGNGTVYDATDSGVINVASVSGNMISSNGGDGMFVRASGPTAIVAGAIGTNGEPINVISANTGFGLNFEATDGGSILGPGATGKFLVRNNQIGAATVGDGNGNLMGGVNALANATAPTISTLNLFIGGPDPGDGNTILANTDVGVAYSLQGNSTGQLMMNNNTISGTTDDLMMMTTPLLGQGVYIEVAGTSTLEGGMIDMNTITLNASHGIQGLVRENAMVNNMIIGNLDGDNDNGNTITDNLGDGIRWQRRDNAQVNNMRIVDNTLMNNLNGLNLISQNASTVDTYIVNDNIITSNNDAINPMMNGIGVRLRVEADADLQVDMDNNLISMNTNDGIQATEFAIPPNDSRTVRGTWTNNEITMNGGFGIDLSAGHQDLVIGTAGNGNLISNNQLTGIRIRSYGDVDINSNMIAMNNLSNAANDPLMSVGGIDFAGATTNDLTIRNNIINNNIGTGVRLANVSGNSIPPYTITLTNNTIDLNTGDGLEINANNPNNLMTITSSLNRIRQNGGRGVDILNQGDSDSIMSFNNETITSNELEGFYVVNSASTNQNQSDAAANGTLLADGSVFATPTLDLTLTNSVVSFNGNSSSFDGTGFVLRVGTSDASTSITDPGGFASDGRGGVIANVSGNMFAGNFGDDVIFESFVSTDDPATTVGTWDDMDDADPTNDVFTVTSYVSDPLARLDLNFVGNTGDSADVTRFGAFYNNDEPVFKSRTTAQDPGGPFTTGTRARNAQRLASRDAPFNAPVVNFGGSQNFLYPGVGDSTFRRTAASTTFGFGITDFFTDSVILGGATGELDFEWGIVP